MLRAKACIRAEAMKGIQDVKSLDRGLRVLMSISKYGPSTCSELARHCEISRASVSRYLKTLVNNGLVRSNDRPKSYHLASGILGLSHGFDRWDHLTEVAARVLQKPENQLLWPLSVVTPLGLQLVIRFNTDQRSPLALERYRVGETLPLLDTASGLVFMANVSERERSEYLDLVADNAEAISLGLLPKTLSEIRHKGYAVHKRSAYSEAAVSVPLYESGDCMGALAMRFIPSALGTEKVIETYVPKLLDMSNEINLDSTINALNPVLNLAS